VPSNHPPMLAPITNQLLAVGMTLSFTNAASDPDSPPQTLTFSLGVGAATNADLNPTNGIFTWAPAQSQIGTNNFEVVVTDNGVPPLSATQTFAVIVIPSNSPPVLAAIANQTLYALTTLTLTNSATDLDSPPQVLTFSLDPGAPAGAGIGPTNGILVWTPSLAQLGTNSLTVRVTDNGLPNLSDFKTFSVIVLPGPTLLTPALTNGVVTLSWDAIAGVSYRVQFKTNLADTAWTDLVPDVLSGGPIATMTDTNVGTAAFYRVLVVQ
jgi:hypothetical protein